MSNGAIQEGVDAEWMSSNTVVATITSSGLLAGRQPGGFGVSVNAEGLSARLSGLRVAPPQESDFTIRTSIGTRLLTTRRTGSSSTCTHHVAISRLELGIRVYATNSLFVDCDQRLRNFDPGELQEELVIPSVCGLNVQWNALYDHAAGRSPVRGVRPVQSGKYTGVEKPARCRGRCTGASRTKSAVTGVGPWKERGGCGAHGSGNSSLSDPGKPTPIRKSQTLRGRFRRRHHDHHHRRRHRHRRKNSFWLIRSTAPLGSRMPVHSGRVGLASELTARGASTTEVMLAGNWKTARMVAHYAAGATAERGAVQKYL